MEEQSDTPRTDAAAQFVSHFGWQVHADFARALERELATATRERDEARVSVDTLRAAIKTAEAALADIGDSDHEPSDDLAWCERRAQQALPVVRFALAATEAKPVNPDGLPTYDKEKALEWVAQLRDGNKEAKP